MDNMRIGIINLSNFSAVEYNFTDTVSNIGNVKIISKKTRYSGNPECFLK